MRSREIHLGKILGIEITLDYSWFWIFALITISFSTRLLPSLDPNRSNTVYALLGVIGSLLFFFSVIVHEISHTLVARANNLPIKKITLFLFGGAANLTQEPPSAKSEFAMAAAGPITSFVIGLLLIGASQIGTTSLFGSLIQVIGFINVALAVFNLLPGFPLDGGRMLRAVFWWYTKDLVRATKWAAVGGKVVAGGLALLGIFETFTVSLLGGAWLILIGFFLYQTAASSYRQTIFFLMLEAVTVREIMVKDEVNVDAGARVGEVIDIIRSRRVDYFVAREAGRPVGLLVKQEVGQIPESEWNKLVRDYVWPFDQLPTVTPDERAADALQKISEEDYQALPVFEDDEFIGLVSIEDMNNYVVSKLARRGGRRTGI